MSGAARAASRPLGLILAVTTIFAVGRLVVPRTGTPPLPGLIGFARADRRSASAWWCCSTGIRPCRVTWSGIRTSWCSTATASPGRRRRRNGRRVAGWLITARVAAFTYSPLMLVPCLIAVGELRARPEYLLAVIFWFAAGIGVSYVVLLTTFFLLRSKAFARTVLVWISLGVLIIDLPLCYLLLGAGRADPRRRPAGRGGDPHLLRGLAGAARPPPSPPDRGRRRMTAADDGPSTSRSSGRDRPGPPPRSPPAGPAPGCCCWTGPTSRATSRAATASPPTRSTCWPSLGVAGVTDGYPPIERLRLVGPGGGAVARPLPRPAHTVPRRVFDARLVGGRRGERRGAARNTPCGRSGTTAGCGSTTCARPTC